MAAYFRAIDGGLDMAVEQVMGAKPAWFVEYDKAPSKILDHHWPDVPNYGDVTKVDWATMPPVDIITGGSPCQDLSAAGKRAGMTEGTRSNLWVNMREAIRIIRPRLVVWENVQGALSAKAASDSDMEPGSGQVGDGGGDNLRALGRVLGDLAEIGYDTQWTIVRASDVGAPHHRARVFLIATTAHPGRERHGGGVFTGHVGRVDQPDETEAWEWQRSWEVAECRGTAAPADAEDDGLAWAGPARHRRARPADSSGGDMDWGPYTEAVQRWERLTRPAPAPTEPNTKGNPRLAATFSEWMMGLPEGHVTQVPGISRANQLKAIGNGVCVPQAIAALRMLLDQTELLEMECI